MNKKLSMDELQRISVDEFKKSKTSGSYRFRQCSQHE